MRSHLPLLPSTQPWAIVGFEKPLIGWRCIAMYPRDSIHQEGALVAYTIGSLAVLIWAALFVERNYTSLSLPQTPCLFNLKRLPIKPTFSVW
ncbi:hypothetical protein K474DRAFT_237443 [Panus rudis PR-1116 ss-1]|nr:hypothetical protein K474DRAFT_237443 [Panus rudis PR-1116 ss-1]